MAAVGAFESGAYAMRKHTYRYPEGAIERNVKTNADVGTVICGQIMRYPRAAFVKHKTQAALDNVIFASVKTQ